MPRCVLRRSDHSKVARNLAQGRTPQGVLYSRLVAPVTGIRANIRKRRPSYLFEYVRLGLTVLIFPFLFVPLPATAQTQSSSFEDLVASATAAREQNDLPHAIELYGRAVQTNPRWADGWWFLGSLQYSAGSYDAARDALTQYIGLTPNAAPAFAMRGLCEFETSDYVASLKDLQQGIQMGAAVQPRNAKILRYHEALLLTRANRFEEALKNYDFFAHEDAPPNPELLIAVGLAGLRIPVLPKELAQDKMDLVSSAGKAALDFMKGDRELAGGEFQSLFQKYPTAVNAHYFYGYLLYPIDVNQGAIEFRRELDIAPDNATVEAVLAWILVLQDRVSEAMPYAEKAAAQDPNLPSVQLVLGKALTETGDAKAGTEHLEKALTLQPGNLEVHLALVKAYAETGRKEDARRERLLCLEMSKNNAQQTQRP